VDGRELQVAAGDVSILDLSRSLNTVAPAAQCVSLVVPRDVMEMLLNATPDLHGLVLREGSARLFGDYLSSLDKQLPGMALDQAPRIARATCELLAACLVPSVQHLQQAQPQIQAVRLQQVRQYIDEQLGSPQLNPAQICWALSISRSQLYRMFEASGGVRKYIQTRRLMRIHSALTDPEQTCSIMSLGERYGFISHAHLSRAFREQFGYNPSDARSQPQLSVQARRGQSLEPSGDEREGFDVWLRELRN
jgi:AraC-like DNA-binding protein